jgi:hypothetical protein
MKPFNKEKYHKLVYRKEDANIELKDSLLLKYITENVYQNNHDLPEKSGDINLR